VVLRCAESLFASFVECSLHYGRGGAKEFDALDTFLCHHLDPVARILRRPDGPIKAASEDGIGLDTWRCDGVVVRQALHFQKPIGAFGSHDSGCGDAMRHPQLGHVFERRALPRINRVRMPMHIDEARQDIHSVRIDLSCARRWPTYRTDGQTWITDALDLHDPVAFNHDIHGPSRRCARPFDHDGAADYQSLIWPFAI